VKRLAPRYGALIKGGGEMKVFWIKLNENTPAHDSEVLVKIDDGTSKVRLGLLITTAKAASIRQVVTRRTTVGGTWYLTAQL